MNEMFGGHTAPEEEYSDYQIDEEAGVNQAETVPGPGDSPTMTDEEIGIRNKLQREINKIMNGGKPTVVSHEQGLMIGEIVNMTMELLYHPESEGEMEALHLETLLLIEQVIETDNLSATEKVCEAHRHIRFWREDLPPEEWEAKPEGDQPRRSSAGGADYEMYLPFSEQEDPMSQEKARHTKSEWVPGSNTEHYPQPTPLLFMATEYGVKIEPHEMPMGGAYGALRRIADGVENPQGAARLALEEFYSKRPNPEREGFALHPDHLLALQSMIEDWADVWWSDAEKEENDGT